MTDDNLPAFVTQLDSDLQGDERLTSLKDKTVSDLVRGHFSAEDNISSLKKAQEGMVAIPGEETPDDERSAFYSKLGRPESHDGYEFETIELPEGREADKVLNEKIRKIAFNNGVSGGALKALHKTVTEHGVLQHNEVQKLIKEQNDKDTNTLKNIWQGDTFKENTDKAERTLRAVIEKLNVPDALGGKEGMIEEFKIMGFLDDSNPKFRYFMAEMFNLIGDDTFIEGLGGSGTPKESKKTDSGFSMMSFPSMEGKK